MNVGMKGILEGFNERASMFSVISIWFIVLLSGHSALADYSCLCDVTHADIQILECPDNHAKVVGFMYASDVNNNFQGIQDTSQPHCKAIAVNITAPPGWTAVYHYKHIGFVATDAGDRKMTCTGNIKTENMTLASHCNLQVQISTTQQVMPTSPHYKCLCDIQHADIPIQQCPKQQSQVIGFMYASDNNNNFHSIQDSSQPHCKPIAVHVNAPSGWVAVYHFNQIGFVAMDSGDKRVTCTGTLQVANWTVSPQCKNESVIQTTRPVVHSSFHTSHSTNGPPQPSPTSTVISPQPPTTTTTAPPPSTTTSTNPPQPTTSTTVPPSSTTTSTNPPPPTTSTATTHAPTSPTTTATSPPTPSTTSTTMVSSTPIVRTTPGIVFPLCDKLGLVLDLGKHEPIEHHNARPCDNGAFHSEAVLMKHCGAPLIEKTTKGLRVLDHCQDIPMYTPISMFVGNTNMQLSAVFFRCEDAHTMTVIQQECGIPKVEQINTQKGAELFYTIHY